MEKHNLQHGEPGDEIMKIDYEPGRRCRMRRDRCELYICMVIGLALMIALGGCTRYRETGIREAPMHEAPATAETIESAETEEAGRTVGAQRERLLREESLQEVQFFETRNIHFEFDRYDLGAEARAVLDKLGTWLLENGDFGVVIEGHCDERGTDEYNLVLGERRAKAARDYLVAMGVGAGRVGTISYGEERPLDRGNNEEAWAKNRRAEFIIKSR
ncbi:MAG: hypothetical protein AVO39_08550 [delta proteobacterium MLS_D]|nr:MAG: hypothetical protein AVO39_08550 [delta proteobacterium MLS_D]